MGSCSENQELEKGGKTPNAGVAAPVSGVGYFCSQMPEAEQVPDACGNTACFLFVRTDSANSLQEGKSGVGSLFRMLGLFSSSQTTGKRGEPGTAVSWCVHYCVI